MTISYPLSLPSTLQFRTVNWREVDVTSDMASPFDGTSDTIDWGGRWFAATLTLVAMTRAQAQVWDAWISSLRGHTGTFLMGAPLRSAPLGSAATAPGTPLINGAVAADATSVAIDGLPANAAAYLKAGDLVGFGSGSTTRLHKVLADVASNGSGQATLDLWPNVREALADNAAVTVSGAKGVFHRVSAVTDWKVTPGDRGGGLIGERSFDVKEKL